MRAASCIKISLLCSSLGLATIAGCGKDKEESEPRTKKATGSGSGSGTGTASDDDDDSGTGSGTGSAAAADAGTLTGEWLTGCDEGSGGVFTRIGFDFDLEQKTYQVNYGSYTDKTCGQEASARIETGTFSTTGDGKTGEADIDLKPADIAQRFRRQAELDAANAGKNCGHDDWQLNKPISIDKTSCVTLGEDGKILGRFSLKDGLKIAVDTAKPGERPKDLKKAIALTRK